MAKRGPKIIPFKVTVAEPLTIESLRAYEGCGQYSDDEARHVISSLREFATILLKAVLKKAPPIDYHSTIHLTPQLKAA